MSYFRYGWYPRQPTVAEKRARALREIAKLRKKGQKIEPVEIGGRTIARSFWGKAWCDQLESFSDYANRLPRGRSYVRAGTVCHLKISEGLVEALVSGSSLYKVNVQINPLADENWQRVKKRCSGQIGSLLELLQGKLSDHVMETVTDRENGLFPLHGEMEFECSCPDWAEMCKHVAAVLYGVGARLDKQPELLFTLRGVEHEELIAGKLDVVSTGSLSDERRRIDDDALGDVFGIAISDETDQAENAAGNRSTKGASRDTGKANPARSKKRKDPGHKDQTAPPAKKTASKRVAKPSAKRKTERRTTSSLEGNSKPERLNAPRKRTGYRGPARQQKVADAKNAASSTSKRTPSRTAPPVTGKKVAALRKKWKMTKAQFAKLVGVSVQTVTNWEANSEPLKLQDRTMKAWRTVEKLTPKTAWKKLERL